MYLFRRKSLRGQLVRRLSVLIAGVLFLIVMGFAIVVAQLVPDARGVDVDILPDIQASLDIEQGALVVRPTERLNAIAAEHPDFWFVADAGGGVAVQFGQTPEAYLGVAQSAAALRHFEAQAPGQPRLTAAFSSSRIRETKVNIVYGGVVTKAPIFAVVAFIIALIYLPFLAIWLLVSMFAVPAIVNRSLAGVRRVTDLATTVQADSLPAPLPNNIVPDEIEPLVAAVNRSYSTVRETIQSRQRFLSDAAHELRTPISILQTRLDSLPDVPDRAGLLRDAARLGVIAEQLLDRQRFAFIHQTAPVDLRAVAKLAVADMAPAAILAGYDLEFDDPDRPVMIEGDAASIDRAITNLLSNAIQHAGNLGTITLAVTRAGLVTVSDDGPGVPPGAADLIFEPFYRARSQGTGAGLGLALVRQIARLHGGDVRLVQAGGGATFQMWLSKAAAPAADGRSI